MKTVHLVMLGASVFPDRPELSSPAFRVSADRLRKLLRGQFNVADDNILDLFDSELPWSEQSAALRAFLTKVGPNSEPPLIIFYYVGHGEYLHTPIKRYYLFLRTTNGGDVGSSALFLDNLAAIIASHTRSAHTLVILDACFSGSASGAFAQSAPVYDGTWANCEHETPNPGSVSILCSSAAQNRSYIAPDESGTLFSKALGIVLETGNETLDRPNLTLREIRIQLHRCLRRLYNEYRTFYPDQAPKICPYPEVHSPVQKQGDLADVQLFNNPRLAFPKRLVSLEEFYDFALPFLILCAPCIRLSRPARVANCVGWVAVGCLLIWYWFNYALPWSREIISLNNDASLRTYSSLHFYLFAAHYFVLGGVFMSFTLVAYRTYLLHMLAPMFGIITIVAIATPAWLIILWNWPSPSQGEVACDPFVLLVIKLYPITFGIVMSCVKVTFWTAILLVFWRDDAATDLSK